jgi:predicted membrane channel-forming protein YqfA (hemolysin III family)
MEKQKKGQSDQELKYHLAGWIVFIVCAGFFLASSVKNHDMLTFIGSLLFLIACVIFLIPLVDSCKKRGKDTPLHEDKTTI